MPFNKRKRPAALWFLLFLLVFQAISAIPPGLMLVVVPSGDLLPMPVSMLEGSPFPDFLVPGLTLFLLLGLGALFVAAGLFFLPAWSWAERLNPFKSQHWSFAASLCFGLALMTWIVVQVLIVGGGSWLQPFYFAVGLAILALSLVPSVRKHLGQP